MDAIGSILFSTPVLMAACLVPILLHVLEFFMGGKLVMSAVNCLAHVAVILTFLYFRATLLDILIMLLLSMAACLSLRLIRRKNK